MLHDDTKIWKLTELYQESKKLDTIFIFQDHYLPELRTSNPDDPNAEYFISTKSKSINAINGMQAIRYLLIDRRGNMYNDIDESANLEQLLPHSIIIRVSCPLRGMIADNLAIDYIIDTDHIELEAIVNLDKMPELRVKSLSFDQSAISLADDTKIVLTEDSQYYVSNKDVLFTFAFQHDF